MPTGTFTFLFTDIEGSTKRWEQQPAEMSAALARHDALLRAAIDTNGGHVDAFCAAFPTASQSLFNNIDGRLEDDVKDGYEKSTISQRPDR